MKEIATHAHTQLPTFCSSSASLWPPQEVKSWQADHAPGWPILFGMYHSAGDEGYGSALQAYEKSHWENRDNSSDTWRPSVCAYICMCNTINAHMHTTELLFTHVNIQL